MARKDKLALVHDLYETVEEITGQPYMRLNGERAYVTDPTRALSLRHELIADMASLGMKPSQIARTMSSSGRSDGCHHYAALLRDPRIRARAKNEDVKEAIERAKKKLADSLDSAATNVANAVEGGDLKMSTFVLGTHGVTEKPASQTTNVNMDFGAWLSATTNTKTMHDITGHEAEKKEIVADYTALPEADGDTLVD